MQLSSLGSGSRGNATVVELADQTILVDCGFGLKDAIRRLELIGRSPQDLSAILVTHEHSDHISGVESLAAKYAIPVYMTAGTRRSWRSRGRVEPNLICADQIIVLGDVEVRPVSVPHDAREPVQFVFEFSGFKLGILTDLGSLTPHLVDAYLDCNALLIEANHDLEMIANGPYPESLKRRVQGAWGHLNNLQTAELVRRINENNRLEHLVIGHISQQNNTPELAANALEDVTRNIARVIYAGQETPLDWVCFK